MISQQDELDRNWSNERYLEIVSAMPKSLTKIVVALTLSACFILLIVGWGIKYPNIITIQVEIISPLSMASEIIVNGNLPSNLSSHITGRRVQIRLESDISKVVVGTISNISVTEKGINRITVTLQKGSTTKDLFISKFPPQKIESEMNIILDDVKFYQYFFRIFKSKTKIT